MRWLVNGDEHEFGSSTPEIEIDGDRAWVHTSDGWRSAVVFRRGNQVHVSYRGRQYVLEQVRAASSQGSASTSRELRAPMPGLLVSVSVKSGDLVQKGDVLMVLEAMKTQIPIISPRDGNVELMAIHSQQQVKANQILAIVNEVANH